MQRSPVSKTPFASSWTRPGKPRQPRLIGLLLLKGSMISSRSSDNYPERFLVCCEKFWAAQRIERDRSFQRFHDCKNMEGKKMKQQRFLIFLPDMFLLDVRVAKFGCGSAELGLCGEFLLKNSSRRRPAFAIVSLFRRFRHRIVYHLFEFIQILAELGSALARNANHGEWPIPFRALRYLD